MYIHLINKTTRASPSFVGPIFVHTEKTCESYYHFFTTLLKQVIVKAAVHGFSDKLIHLRCFIHIKDKRKLTEMIIPGMK